MNNFNIALDKYLTSDPYDDFTNYCENVGEFLTDEFWENNEEWFLESNLADEWLNFCYYKFSEKRAAEIIERAFKIYKIDKL